MGSNAGFNKETTLIKSINNKSLKEMNSSSVILLKKLFPNYNFDNLSVMDAISSIQNSS